MSNVLARATIVGAFASGYVAAALFLSTALFIGYDVIGRWLFHAPTAWSLELSTYAFMMGAFLGGPYALHRGEHVFVELLSTMLTPHRRRVVHAAILAGGIILFALLTWFAIRFSYSSYTLNLRSPILQLPVWPVQAAVPVSFVLIVAEALRQFVVAIREIAGAGHDPGETTKVLVS